MAKEFSGFDAYEGFDVETLSPGELVIQLNGLKEREDKDKNPIYEFGYKLVAVANEDEHQQFVTNQEKPLEGKYTMWLSNVTEMQFSILKNMLKNGGFNVPNWTKANGMPLSRMVPGALKFLAQNNAYILCKIALGKPKEGEQPRKFFNFSRIERSDLRTAQRYADALPDSISDDDVIKAFNKVDMKNASDMF